MIHGLIFLTIVGMNMASLFFASSMVDGFRIRSLKGGVLLGFLAATICYATVPLLNLLGIPVIIFSSAIFQFGMLTLVILQVGGLATTIRVDSLRSAVFGAAVVTPLNWLISIVCNLSIWL